MADTQKPAEVPETTPAATELLADTKPVDTTPAAADTTATDAPAETKTDETPAVAAGETKKEEVKPIDAGTLEHKGAPANFPKNLLYSKHHFWFGNDALETEKLSTYLKNEKVADIGHHVTSWAAETGKGLLFYSKESDKSTPTGAIQLADAAEPTVDGTHKFSFTSKGHKHTFKAPSTADRDNWVGQLKLKIAEAKELASTVPESETYKKTLESFKPAPPPKKAEKPVEPARDEIPVATGLPAATATAPEEPKEEIKKEDSKEEKLEEEKKRSSSKKRTSIFGSFLGKKEEPKKDEPKETAVDDKSSEDKPADATPAVVEPTPEPAPAETTTETPVITDTPAAPEEPKEEPKKEEIKKETKPTPSKRNSIFGNLSFGKKKSEAEPTTPSKETPAPLAPEVPVTETAPVIPAVETTEPLSAEVASPANVPTETTDATPATNGEPAKKEVKNDKRKSSLPFAFGKKDKSAPTSDEEGEKAKSPPFFSKFRQTINRKDKGADKAADKPTNEVKEADKSAETTDDKPVETLAEPTSDTKAEAIDESTAEKPTVPASAPVTAAA